MKDENKTKEQLLSELVEMRQRVVELEASPTERKRAKKKLRELSSAIEESIDGIAIGDLEPKLTYMNKAFAQMHGYSREEMIGMKVANLHNEEQTEEFRKGIDQIITQGSWMGEIGHVKKGGTAFPTYMSVTLLKDGEKPTGILAVARDITERKRVDEALRESEERWRSLVENAPDLIIIVSPDGTMQFINYTVPGFTRGEVIGTSIYEYIQPEYHDVVRDTIERVFETGDSGSHEIRGTGPDGRISWYEMRVGPIKCDGRVVAVTLIAADITERKRAQDALQESERKSKAMLESIGDHMSMMDKDLNIIWANDVAKRIFGDDIVGKKCYAAYHGRTKPCEPYPCLTLKAFRDGKIHRHETQVIGKNGGIIDFHCTASVVLWDGDGNPAGVIEISRDTTGRRQAEEEIHRLSQYLRSIINNANVVLQVIDRQGNVLLWNKAAEVISGYSREEVVGHNKVWKWLYPDKEYRRENAARAAAVIEGEILEDFQSTVRTKAGEDRMLSFYSTSLVDEEGNSNGSLWLGTDITGRKRGEAEKRELEQRAQLASRLTTVGEMASGIAHEINNPLTSVIGFAQLLMRKDIPEDIKEDAKIMNDSAQRVANIVKRLLAFARQRKPERVYADINDIIETTLAMRAYAMETSNIKVVTQLDPELPRTMADASQLQQVFLNIILNAETEMKLAHGSGKLVVGTRTVDNTIRISFGDDGPGITKENLGRIFDPFFTAREAGEGTGLGLSICHAIVAEHNGQLYVKSKLGKGATFAVELPVIAEEKQLGLPEAAPDDSIKIGRAKILVVDDELGTLELLSQILTADGHEVQTATTARHALKRIESERYSLILLDIKLPGTSGVELYKSIEKVAQSLARRVLFITGDVMGVDTKDFLSKIKAPYVAKPFDIEHLKQVVDRMLARSA